MAHGNDRAPSEPERILTVPHTTGERLETAVPDNKKQWMGYALALSLALHIGAALLVLFAFGSGPSVKTPGSLVIQEVDLTPAISAAPGTSPPPPSSAMTEPEAPETDEPQQQAAPERQPSSQQVEQNRVFQTTPLGLGMAHGYFTGLGSGVSLREDIREYYFEMVGKINGEWWSRSETLTEALRQDGVVELTITRDGTIVTIRILQGTGSREADRLLTESIRNARLAPLPPAYDLDLFSVPLRIKAPSSLFRPGS